AMAQSPVEPADLLDLKLLPAWVTEPREPGRYERYTGAEESGVQKKGTARPQHRRSKRRTSDFDKARADIQHPTSEQDRGQRGRLRKKTGRRDGRTHGAEDRPSPNRHVPATQTPAVTIRFLPYSVVFENVVAQIKSGSVAYSLFALARLFLEKPVGYEVCLKAKQESPLYQLGDNGMVSADREFLDRSAFRFAHRDFYKIDVSETDPIKGNFSNVARCRLSGTLLGPTNHHSYQPQLRSLYEQRFSRRMSFADYQRQIEIVSDAALVERWKEEARKVTIYTTLREENPVTFSSAVEVERHFRSHYLPGLIRSVEEVTIGGSHSRSLPHRILNQAIEEAWATETRSPSNMMQELASRFRQNGLHVFRHRRGMLFVSPIRERAFVHEQAGVSPSVNAILHALSGTAAISRKQFFEKLIGDGASEDVEARGLALASDLRWLINEGYVIEFNDGSLDLPRGKSKQQQETVEALAAASAWAVDTTVPTRSWPLQLTWREQ
ncbi:MAG TPA: hypothetical protein VJ420_02290, partial [Candidatus Udaeobacter sp.]|nr:hypothetical protein [Candidatus Udaeobacter sp.]